MGLKDIFTNKRFWLITGVSIIFIIIAVYTYRTYIAPNSNYVANKEFVNSGPSDNVDSADLYFFYTDWCPHSKKSKPIVDKVKRLYDGKPINGITVHFHEINGESQEDKMNEFEKRHSVSIDGYPTIYLVKGDQVIEYDANPTQDSITEFLNTAL